MGDVLNKSISILHHNIRSLRNKIQDIAGPLFGNSYRKMISDALDCSSKIISLGDHNVDFLRPLPTCIWVRKQD